MTPMVGEGYEGEGLWGTGAMRERGRRGYEGEGL